MSTSARVVVLMSPAEKRALDGKAVRAGRISSGELVRRAVEAYDEEAVAEAAQLREMLGLIGNIHSETVQRLDATERKLDDTLAFLQSRRGA